MANEVIDLTTSPSSPPPPPLPPPRSSKPKRIVRFTASTSSNKIQFKIKKSSRSTRNLSSSYINQQVAPWVPRDPFGQIYDFSQIINNVHSNMHGDQAQAQAQAKAQAQLVATMYGPNVATPNAFLFPQGTKLRKPWTPEEHEQFVMGLLKFGSGWTAQEVESHATNFFRHLPSTCLYSLRKKNSSFVSDSNPMMMKEDMGPPPTLMLFPHIGGEASSSNSSSAFEDMATTEGEVDLELRLG